MIVSQRIRRIVAERMPGSRGDEVIGLLESLGGDSFFDKQDPDRIAAAVITDALEIEDMDIVSEDARGDFRDLLMGTGLAGEDWREVMDGRFGAA